MMNRYSRQELYAPIGRAGQERLRKATIAIVGCGALGSLQAEVLTRAGIGKLILIDRDFVEPVNLQRQSLFTESDASESLPKAIAAAGRLKEINAEVEVEPHVRDLDPDSMDVLEQADLILDGTDNFQTRYLLNDYCWKNGVSWIYGACVGSTAVASVFIPQDFPCLRCLFEAEPPPGTAPTCDTAGIIWPAVGLVVSYQVSSAFKILVGAEMQPELLQADVWESQYRIVTLMKAKRPDCATCGARTYPALAQRSEYEIALCGRDAVQIKPARKAKIDLDEIYDRWKEVSETSRNPFLVRLVAGENEIVLFPDGRAMIKGTHDFARARTLYARYVGI